MLAEQGYKTFLIRKLTIILFIVAMTWTTISLYCYYTGPVFKIDTYIGYLTKKEYTKVYEMFDQDEVLNKYSKEQIIAYYTSIYDGENSLIEMTKKSSVIFNNSSADEENKMAFCNIQYVCTTGEKTVPLHLTKREDQWVIKFPFILSDIKIHAPMDSSVYINAKKIDTYENEMYIQRDVLPGKYRVQIDFPNQIYSTHNQVINVPDEKEVFLPYNTLSVQIETVKNMIVQLQDVKKNSVDGVAVFNNILEGNYTLKVFSKNNFINPIELDIGVSKDERSFSILDVTLSQTGKEQLGEFIKEFYKDYLKDIKAQKCTHISTYIHEETSEDFINHFTQWFIADKDVQDAKIVIEPSRMEIDRRGFLHTDLLEIVELTNKEFDEYRNGYINRQYKIILEWDTIIDISEEKWLITDRTMKQSIVSYKDQDGNWVQY